VVTGIVRVVDERPQDAEALRARLFPPFPEPAPAFR
jgi:hypothetical protein